MDQPESENRRMGAGSRAGRSRLSVTGATRRRTPLGASRQSLWSVGLEERTRASPLERHGVVIPNVDSRWLGAAWSGGHRQAGLTTARCCHRASRQVPRKNAHARSLRSTRLKIYRSISDREFLYSPLRPPVTRGVGSPSRTPPNRTPANLTAEKVV